MTTVHHDKIEKPIINGIRLIKPATPARANMKS